MSVETKLAGAAPSAISRGICSLMDPACRESGGCGGGGADRSSGICLSDDRDLGVGIKTSIVSQAQLFGAGYSLGYTPGGTAGAYQTFQAGGVGMGFAREASDVFTEGEGVAGHPAKWGYRPIRSACKPAAVKTVSPASGISHPAGWIIGIILAFFILD